MLCLRRLREKWEKGVLKSRDETSQKNRAESGVEEDGAKSSLTAERNARLRGTAPSCRRLAAPLHFESSQWTVEPLPPLADWSKEVVGMLPESAGVRGRCGVRDGGCRADLEGRH